MARGIIIKNSLFDKIDHPLACKLIEGPFTLRFRNCLTSSLSCLCSRSLIWIRCQRAERLDGLPYLGNGNRDLSFGGLDPARLVAVAVSPVFLGLAAFVVLPAKEIRDLLLQSLLEQSLHAKLEKSA